MQNEMITTTGTVAREQFAARREMKNTTGTNAYAVSVTRKEKLLHRNTIGTAAHAESADWCCGAAVTSTIGTDVRVTSAEQSGKKVMNLMGAFALSVVRKCMIGSTSSRNMPIPSNSKLVAEGLKTCG